jgi:AraC-like DNA-binding protein
MIYQTYRPCVQLQEFVRMYHLLHFDLKGFTAAPTKAYFPHAEQCLTFDPRGRVTGINRHTGALQHRSFSYLSQQQTSTYDLSFEQEYMMLKVVFKPGGLFRLLGIPLYEFGDSYVDAESVIPVEVRAVNEQLACAQTYPQMITVVESYLTQKVKKHSIARQPIDRAFELMANHSIFPLAWIADQACLSIRQLERKYRERIGVSPVVYNRILRFNKAFRIKEASPELSWLAVAITCGYTNLQHLIKDFKQFSGSTPTQLLYEERTSIQHQLKLV